MQQGGEVWEKSVDTKGLVLPKTKKSDIKKDMGII